MAGFFDDLPDLPVTPPPGPPLRSAVNPTVPFFSDLPDVPQSTFSLPVDTAVPMMTMPASPMLGTDPGIPVQPAFPVTPTPMQVPDLFGDLPDTRGPWDSAFPDGAAPSPVPQVPMLGGGPQDVPWVIPAPRAPAPLPPLQGPAGSNADPFANESLGDLLARRGQQVAQGATDVFASVPEALAINQAQFEAAMRDNAPDRIREAARQAEAFRSILESGLSPMSGTPMTPEERAVYQTRFDDSLTALRNWVEQSDMGVVPAEARPSFQQGDALRQAVTDLVGQADPRDQTFWANLAQGAGNIGGLVATTMAAGLAGPGPAIAVGSGLAASQGEAQQYRDARQSGADEETARTAGTFGGLIGLTEMIPIDRALRIIPPRLRNAVGGAINRRVSDILQGSGEEAAQEYLSQVMQNITAAGLYDPERGWTEGASEAAVIGAILGAGVGAIGSATNPDEASAPTMAAPPQVTPPVMTAPSEDAAPVVPVAPQAAPEPVQPSAPPQPVRNDAPPEAPVPPTPTPVDQAAQAVPQGDSAPVNPERVTTVYTPDNDPVEVETMVVEAGSLLTSDQEGYPQELQPRDRTRAASLTQIEGIANRPVPQRLDQSPESDRGAPIIGPDGRVVESGNGRIMGLRLAYERGTAAEYRAYVEANYPEAAGMTNPVIIRRRISDIDERNFTTASNQSATLAMSASEQARSDSQMIDDSVLSLYRGGGIGNAGNRDMIRAFIGKLPQTAQGALVTKDGGLTVDGQRRFQTALFQRAWGDDKLLARMSESTDDDMRSATSAMTEAAGYVARVRAAIERGEVNPAADFAPLLVKAVQDIADFRSRGEDLKGARAQTDAFAQPLDDYAQMVQAAFFNKTGTRMAGKAKMQDWIETMADETMKEKIDIADLPGVEPRKPRSLVEIGNEVNRRLERDSAESATLLESAGNRSPRNDQGGPAARRPDDGPGRAKARTETLNDSSQARVGRINPRGTLAPEFLDFSFTNKNSIFYAAFRAAGIDPKDGMLMDADKQIRILQQVIAKRFGIKVVLPQRTIQRKTLTGRTVKESRNQILSRDAIDQMLDAYRQLEMMVHVAGLPMEAVALKNKDGEGLTLSLSAKLPGALGSYSYDPDGENSQRLIALPGRSNSFAHEWGHALDHWVGMFMNDSLAATLYTRDIKKNGVTPKGPVQQRIAESYVGIMQAMFGERAALAALQIDLQLKAAQINTKTGNPTGAAKAAQKLLDDIKSGKKVPQSVSSRYFQTSAQYDAMMNMGGYFTDPAEMFARAFEAFIGTKATAVSDLPAGFLTKPDWAYSQSEEKRAAMTFPREVDATEIFHAFETLTDALREASVFGTDHRVNKPEDADVYDMRHWDKWVPKTGLLARERYEWDAAKASRQPKRPRSEAELRVMDTAHILGSSTMGYVRSLIKRQPKASQEVLTNIADMFMPEPGSGRVTGVNWEQAVERKYRQMTTRFQNVVREYGLVKEAATDSPGAKDLRLVLTVGDYKATNPKIAAAAPHLRRLMDDAWRYMQEAGIDVGYARNGYLPRTTNKQAITDKPAVFLDKARQVYEIIFDRDVRTGDQNEEISDLSKLVKRLSKAERTDDQGERFNISLFSPDQMDRINEWKGELKKLQRAIRNLKAAEQDGDPDKIAKAMEKLDEVQADYKPLHEEALDIVSQVWGEESARNWKSRIMIGGPLDFDSAGPTQSFIKSRVLPPEADRILADFYVQDPLDLISDYLQRAPRRTEYVRRAGEGGEKMQRMFERAESLGANGEVIKEIRSIINRLTGQDGFTEHSSASYFMGWIYTSATITLLKKAVFSSLAEPVTAGIRLQNPMASLRALGATISQIARTGNARDRAEVARVIGLTTSAQYETLMLNRYGGDMDPTGKQAKMLAQFFTWNGLTPLTNMQKNAMLAVSQHAILRHLQAAAKRDSKWSYDELADIGIPREAVPDMLNWIESLGGGYPTSYDLIAADGGFANKAAAMWANALVSLTETIIQNPKRYHRPVAAMSPQFRMIYGITGFTYAFHTEVLLPLFKRHFEGRKDGESFTKFAGRFVYGSSKNLLAAAPALLALFVAQGLSLILRTALDDEETWEKRYGHLSDEELWDWFMGAIFTKEVLSRSGLTGAFDIPLNMVTGVKYGREMAGHFAGPHVAWALNPLDTLVKLYQQEKNTTNTAEFNALKTAGSLLFDTGLPMFLSSFPGGPASNTLKFAISNGIDILDPASTFAEMIAGEKGDQYPEGEMTPWFELGDGIISREPPM